jgi:hypothetical protein
LLALNFKQMLLSFGQFAREVALSLRGGGGVGGGVTQLYRYFSCKAILTILEAAIKQLHRPFINPNPGFLLQLSCFEKEKFGKTTIRFPQDGKAITLRTIYEWEADDGSWIPRVVVGYQMPSAAATAPPAVVAAVVEAPVVRAAAGAAAECCSAAKGMISE